MVVQTCCGLMLVALVKSHVGRTVVVWRWIVFVASVLVVVLVVVKVVEYRP